MSESAAAQTKSCTFNLNLLNKHTTKYHNKYFHLYHRYVYDLHINKPETTGYKTHNIFTFIVY